MPSAEIITIGSEILLGELVDTNSAHIAKSLRAAGIDLFRLSTIGDNVSRISQAILEGLSRADIVITTGGLGPTVDDPTRDAVAQAFGVSLEYHEELWAHIDQRLRNFGRIPGENQRKQAFIPQGAKIIHNPVGTAPAFIVEQANKCVISLPGVPSEMDFLLKKEVLPYLIAKFDIKEIIKVRTIKTFNIGEGMLDEKISDLERLTNPTVGLSAHFGMSDIRITAKASTFEEANAMIDQIEAELRNRIPAYIYGVDDESILDAILAGILKNGEKITIFSPSVPKLGKIADKAPELVYLGENGTTPYYFSSVPDEKSQAMAIGLIGNGEEKSIHRIFAGNPSYFKEWYTNQTYCELLKFVQGPQ